MKSLLIISLVLLTASRHNQNGKDSVNLTCTLTTDKSSYKIGEMPILKVQINNKGDKDIYLIGSLDGSDVTWRFPYCYFTIDKPKPDIVGSLRCGNMNTLRAKDFKMVKPGGQFDPYAGIDGYGFFGDYTTTNIKTFKNPGIYKIKFHYSTNSQNIADFMGDKPLPVDYADSLQISLFFDKVPKLEIISNEIEFRIEE